MACAFAGVKGGKVFIGIKMRKFATVILQLILTVFSLNAFANPLDEVTGKGREYMFDCIGFMNKAKAEVQKVTAASAAQGEALQKATEKKGGVNSNAQLTGLFYATMRENNRLLQEAHDGCTAKQKQFGEFVEEKRSFVRPVSRGALENIEKDYNGQMEKVKATIQAEIRPMGEAMAMGQSQNK